MSVSRTSCVTLCALLSVTALPAAEQQKRDSLKKDAWTIPAGKNDFHVFILMGQSNMSGFGRILPEDKKPVPHVVKLPTKGGIRWEPAAHPLHNRLRSDRFGLGLPFAKEYLKDKPGVVVGLIPVAWGGAPIDMLKKSTPTYSDVIKKARFAKTRGVIKGVLWHQGESDTVSRTRTDSYEKKLHQLIADLRKDVGDGHLPFIVGNLAEFYGTGPGHSAPDRVKRIDRVRLILRTLPKKVANTGFVESTNCASPDRHKVHFDRNSYVILGKRYAKVYKQMTKRANKSPAGDGK